jgi:hypothetical protein
MGAQVIEQIIFAGSICRRFLQSASAALAATMHSLRPRSEKRSLAEGFRFAHRRRGIVKDLCPHIVGEGRSPSIQPPDSGGSSTSTTGVVTGSDSAHAERRRVSPGD